MSAAAEIQPMFFDEDGGKDLEIQFDPRQFRAVTPYSEDLDLENEYEAAQDELRLLKQKEEQLRRQAEELKELTHQEETFRTSREEVAESLSRHLEILERESAAAQRRAEDCASAHERLESHLAALSALRPEAWSRAERKTEVARALSCIEAAEDEIDSVQPLVGDAPKRSGRIAALFGGGGGTAPQAAGIHAGDFRYWLKSGFAFSLPLVGFSIVAAIIAYFL